MGEHGQASLDYVAVVGLVALVLVVGTAAAGGPDIGRAVTGSIQRALCLVSAGDCTADGRSRPCVVASDSRSRERTGVVAVVRLGDGRTVLVEERSDGTVAVSLDEGARLGGEMTAGPSAQLSGKGVKTTLQAAADLGGVRGRRWIVTDRAAADALVDGLERGDDLAPPDETFWGGASSVDLAATAKALGAGATASEDVTTVIGIRRDRRTGERTAEMQVGGAIEAALTGPLAALGGGIPGVSRLEVTYDRRDRPVRVTVLLVRGVRGEARIGPYRSSGGDRLELEARLEIDAASRALARDLVSPRALVAARRLGERLADGAHIDVRRYETDRDERVRGGSLSALGRFGYEQLSVHETARLVDAGSYEPGRGWWRRLDCVGVA